MVFPSATSYSMHCMDCSDGWIGIAHRSCRGITVSHAPVSAQSSTSIQLVFLSSCRRDSIALVSCV